MLAVVIRHPRQRSVLFSNEDRKKHMGKDKAYLTDTSTGRLKATVNFESATEVS